jgi:hypothetical protein
MFRKSIALLIGVTAVFTAVQPAIATATKPMKAGCTWTEHGKTSIAQRCTVTGNSGGGSRGYASFRVEWEDGLTTKINCTIADGCKSEGTRKVHLHNTVSLGRMGFPQVIVLEDLGVIVLEYQSGQD